MEGHRPQLEVAVHARRERARGQRPYRARLAGFDAHRGLCGSTPITTVVSVLLQQNRTVVRRVGQRWYEHSTPLLSVDKALRDVNDLRAAVAAFADLYYREWLIEKNGHRTPHETYRDWLARTEPAA